MEIPSDCEVLRCMSSELRGQRDHLADQGDYTEAFKHHTIYQTVEDRLRQEEILNNRINTVREMNNRHGELESIVAGYLEAWEREFREFAEKAEADSEELRQQQEKELDDFDATAPVEISVLFRKRSPRLLALRLKEARQCLIKEFPAAARTRREAENQEEAEVAAGIEKTRQDFLFRRNNLISEQEIAMNAFKVRMEATRNALIMKRDRRISGFLHRMTGLNRELGYKLDALKVSTDEVCDPAPDSERVDYALGSELKGPIPEFRTAVMSLDRKGRRTESAPKTSRRVIYRRLPP
jgi:hypothetical protein